MPVRVPAVTPYHEGIDALLSGDALLVADLAVRADGAISIYSLGTVPKNAPTPFLELGDVTELAWRQFMRGGNRTSQRIIIVAPRADGIPGVAKIYAHLVRLLEGGALAIAGHEIATADVELLTTYNDPNGTDIRGIVQFTVQSSNA